MTQLMSKTNQSMKKRMKSAIAAKADLKRLPMFNSLIVQSAGNLFQPNELLIKQGQGDDTGHILINVH